MDKEKNYLIISDIHSNYTALNTVLKNENLKNKEVICLGDIVGYNTRPNSSVKLIKKVSKQVVAGNHDKAAIDELRTDWFRGDIKKSIKWTKDKLSEDSKKYLKSLNTRKKFKIDGLKFLIAHGSPEPNNPFSYILNKYDIKRIESYIQDVNIVFIGHTHIPKCFCFNGEKWKIIDQEVIKINPNYYYIINPGSIGQPRDRDPRSSYLIYDNKNKEIIFKRLSYNLEQVMESFKNTDLPKEFKERLIHGR